MPTGEYEELGHAFVEALAEAVTLVVAEAGVNTDVDAAARVLAHLEDEGWPDRDALLLAVSARLVYVILESYAASTGVAPRDLWADYLLLRARVLSSDDDA